VLDVFENRVLGRIFGLKCDETVGDWRKLREEKLHNMYSSTDRMIRSWHVARMVEKRSV
jgi:hypothetical protein